ncbi:MAG: hydroxymethylglutaryl-CoA reductase, degradative [Hyphomicrobiales bacterium]
MSKESFVNGFSKLSKREKIELISNLDYIEEDAKDELKTFWHPHIKIQTLLDEFSENSLSNFPLPYGVIPHIKINERDYIVPMVIEESSVVAAASSSAKFWSKNGGFHAEITETDKVGQIHFTIDKSGYQTLKSKINELKKLILSECREIIESMEKRGGGIKDISLLDKNDDLKDYYQLFFTFETCNSMGANFINTVLEKAAKTLNDFVENGYEFKQHNNEFQIIMSILSNYTPNCLCKVWIEASYDQLENIDPNLSGKEFAEKFEKAVIIANNDVYRATTHNKGIFNGIDAVTIATGNDFRAVEACGHAYAARDGKYRGLTSVELKDNKFKYILEIPLSVGTIGGLTNLHPLSRFSMKLLKNPDAKELMKICASVGLANNFSAIKSLITNGIQNGHMKMHLINLLNANDATESEKNKAVDHFKKHNVSATSVKKFLREIR